MNADTVSYESRQDLTGSASPDTGRLPEHCVCRANLLREHWPSLTSVSYSATASPSKAAMSVEAANPRHAAGVAKTWAPSSKSGVHSPYCSL